MPQIDKSAFYGTDTSKEISLFDYGFLIAPYTQDGRTDEYFVVYAIGNDGYDTGFITEEFLNNLINGKEWANENDISNFLSEYEATKEDWLAQSFVHKFFDCFTKWGYENIMGSSYNAMTRDEVIKRYI
jgi:hypothetical protein